MPREEGMIVQCEEAQSLFSDHVDGALPADAEEALGAHVATCSVCRQALLRYERGVSALAGASPEPPGALVERIGRAAVAQGLVGQPARRGVRWLLPVAASLACFALGAAVARHVPRGTEGSHPWPPRFPHASAALACASAPDPQPWGDLVAFRALPATVSAKAAVQTPGYRLQLPRWLTSRGPYAALASAAVQTEAVVCVPLRAAYGERLALSVAPAPTSAASAEEDFVIESDPARVLYGRVTWMRSGLIWSLEGRAESTELLALARELANRAAVERI
jgi:anti-sigma factor RsiW